MENKYLTVWDRVLKRSERTGESMSNILWRAVDLLERTEREEENQRLRKKLKGIQS